MKKSTIPTLTLEYRQLPCDDLPRRLAECYRILGFDFSAYATALPAKAGGEDIPAGSAAAQGEQPSTQEREATR